MLAVILSALLAAHQTTVILAQLPGSPNSGPPDLEMKLESRATVDLNHLRLRAGHGDREGMYLLGMAYLNAHEPYYDLSSALSWLERAASLGQPMAPISLGITLGEYPPGVSDAKIKGFAWLIVAKKDGTHRDFVERLLKLHAKNLTESEFAAAQRMAVGFIKSRSHHYLAPSFSPRSR